MGFIGRAFIPFLPSLIKETSILPGYLWAGSILKIVYSSFYGIQLIRAFGIAALTLKLTVFVGIVMIQIFYMHEFTCMKFISVEYVCKSREMKKFSNKKMSSLKQQQKNAEFFSH